MDIHCKCLRKIRIFIAVHNDINMIASRNVSISLKPLRIQWIQDTINLVRPGDPVGVDLYKICKKLPVCPS